MRFDSLRRGTLALATLYSQRRKTLPKFVTHSVFFTLQSKGRWGSHTYKSWYFNYIAYGDLLFDFNQSALVGESASIGLDAIFIPFLASKRRSVDNPPRVGDHTSGMQAQFNTVSRVTLNNSRLVWTTLVWEKCLLHRYFPNGGSHLLQTSYRRALVQGPPSKLKP